MGVRCGRLGWVWGRRSGRKTCRGAACCAPTVFDSLHLAGLRRPVARWRVNLHLRHHAVSKPGIRRKFGELDQLENNFPLTFRFDTAERAIGEMHSPGGGQEALRPELDFIGIEMHGDVSHWVSYGPVSALVSLPAIVEITTQFITGPMDIG